MEVKLNLIDRNNIPAIKEANFKFILKKNNSRTSMVPLHEFCFKILM